MARLKVVEPNKRKAVCDGKCGASCDLDCRKNDRKNGFSKRRYWIGFVVLLAVVAALFLTTGCSGPQPAATDSSTITDTSTNESAGISTSTSAASEGSSGGSGMSETGMIAERGQQIGYADGVLAGEMEAELSFAKARPLYDGYVTTLTEGYEDCKPYIDEGVVCKMEEFFFYPQINDSTEEARKFNEAMKARLRSDYVDFELRGVERPHDWKGSTYRAYRYRDLVSIVFVDWSCTEESRYAGVLAYVYDTTNGTFLNKKEIVARAGLKDFAFSERFDAWYASTNPNQSASKRAYVPGLLQMWAYDYHLPFGDWVDVMTKADMDSAINIGVKAERVPEYGLFFDDSGDLTLLRTRYDIPDADSENRYYRILFDAESYNWLGEMQYPTVELEIFQTLAQKAGGDQSRTQAFVVYLGNKDNPERIIRKLSAAAEIPEMNLNLKRLITGFETLDGDLEMYLVIPRYENSVMGLEPSPVHWQDYANFGPVIVVKDGNERHLSYVYRGLYTNIMLKNDGEKVLLDAGQEEGIFVDVSEHIGEGRIAEEVELFVKSFYPSYNRRDSNQ